ncbi:MAG: hypothetical protein WAM60_16090 [Candidatus Promineifilaceae bacterium]
MESKRLEKWTQAVGKGDRITLRERLAVEALTVEDIRPFLQRTLLKPMEPLPAWTTTLSEIVEAVSGESLADLASEMSRYARSMDTSTPQPFEGFFIPMVNTIFAEITQRVAPVSSRYKSAG